MGQVCSFETIKCLFNSSSSLVIIIPLVIAPKGVGLF